MKKKRKEKLSDQIRKEINESDISGYQLSRDADVDSAAVSRFRRGKAGISLAALDRIAGQLKLDIIRRKKDG